MATTTQLRRLLEDLDVQIVEQKRVVHDLEQSRNTAERQLYAAAAATSPVLTLPVEITAEIFVHSLPPVDDSTWRRGSRMVPLIVSQPVWESDPVEEFTDQWLARAGACPLSLILTAHVTAYRIRDVINRYSDRVEHLEFCADFDIGDLGLTSAVFPILQSAAFNYGNPALPDRAFSHAPRFHDLRTPHGFSLANCSLPWLQLTKFDGKIGNFDFFSFAPNLVEVRCLFDYDEGFLTATTHSALRSLVLLDGSYDEIIDHLTLPALQHLNVVHMDSYDYLGPFLERSSPPLVSLSVRAHSDKFYQVWNKYLPHVAETLENLHILRPSEEVVIDMFFPFGDRRLQAPPKLRALSLEDVDGGVNLYRLTQFLYLRSGKLRSFRLVWTHSPLMDRWCNAGPSRGTATQDTISGHFSQIADAGTDIYLGTVDKNYAAYCDEA
ncbi:hypothetical protein DFH06DRAFT_1463955 [Mycena polygramma]|nr:hypothetical protein DFH06DRAFT_1463955 [Mycena polygramma]